MTSLLSVGVLGVLAILVPRVLLVLALISAVRSQLFNTNEKLALLALGLSSTYLWFGILFYVPSENVVLLAFAMAAATLGFASRANVREEATASPMYKRGALALAVILALVFVWSGYATSKRALAETYTNQGVALLQQNDADGALAAASRAQSVENTGNDLRLTADAGLVKLQQIAGSSSASSNNTQAQFTAQAQLAIRAGQAAIALNPKDYRGYLSLASVYDYLSTLKINGAYENAQQTYLNAMNFNPTDPQIPLLLSRLEAVQGNVQGVTKYLSQALTMKPDYTDAILFLVQLDVANNDIPNAIRAAQAAVQTAPGVPSLWFELGLLYYSANDTKDAIAPLEQAVKIQSDYANAKYFLGLSYAAQNRTQDAIQQFSDIQKTNPNSAEVNLILSNLQAGKPPFTNAKPPVTSTPQSRITAPVLQ